ncbi:MAG: hypothetical protein KKB51_23930 [Candidatus Riflebacteria bacterium]|nr:hypothetical protein [Candidatus Riflebacteria bacterium]
MEDQEAAPLIPLQCFQIPAAELAGHWSFAVVVVELELEFELEFELELEIELELELEIEIEIGLDSAWRA